MEDILINFNSPLSGDLWENIDDTVMGGISDSEIEITVNNTALFHGTVSLDNNGGFASIRTHPTAFDLSTFQGLVIRAKGDGKDYRLRLRTDNAYEGTAYQARFSTDRDSWSDIRLPFDTFLPVFRGREIKDAPALDPSAVQRIGIMIADRQEGPFRLEIDWIKAYA